MVKNNKFIRGVVALVAGAAGSQLLAILVAPALTRIFTPEDFGVLAIYAGLLGIFTVVASLRFELAIPLPEDDQEAVSIVVLCALLVTIIAGLSAIVVGFFGDAASRMLDAPSLSKYLWLFPFGVFFSGIYQTLNYWAIRKKEFQSIATGRVLQVASTLSVQLFGFKFGSLALIGGQVIGQAVGGGTLCRKSSKNINFLQAKFSNIPLIVYRYRQFPLYSTWAALLNAAGSQIPPLMLAALFGPIAAGLYALAQRVLMLPMSVIGSAIGSVFLSNAAEAYRTGEIAGIMARVHGQLTKIAAAPALVLMVAGPELFGFVFGPEWRQAGFFAQWMAPWLYFVFVTSPLSTLFEVMEKQKQHLLFHVVLLLVRAGAIAIGAWQENLEMAIALFSTGSAICWVWMLFWLNKILKNEWGPLIRSTLRSFGWGGFCLLPLIGGMATSKSISAFILSLAVTTIFILAYYFVNFKNGFTSEQSK
ncbi:lipopolysaccharide biosynthesis protein [Variovorax boronicumulans]|uniref:lipopolysaccharide biosynthesis protein n=1 Tax=Variovorax boronicumulans TaxID=436515 RepID=UPI001330C02D|nr:oligosaccharide flippase family protein [Variovorax boronicumulans]